MIPPLRQRLKALYLLAETNPNAHVLRPLIRYIFSQEFKHIFQREHVDYEVAIIVINMFSESEMLEKSFSKYISMISQYMNQTHRPKIRSLLQAGITAVTQSNNPLHDISNYVYFCLAMTAIVTITFAIQDKNQDKQNSITP
jgi:hypothetical protein